MRTTLTIDDDVFAFACIYAQREHISIDAAISKLTRDGIRAQSTLTDKASKAKSKYALLPIRGEIITKQHVRDLMDLESM
jgi:hypothetical protein